MRESSPVSETGKAREPVPGMVRILLAEDSEHDLRVFRRVMRGFDHDHELTHCARAAQAIELVERDPTAFDILITDYVMPGMTGLELCEEMLARKVPFPIVILTGTGSESVAADALRLGIDGYIIKDPDHGYGELVTETIDFVLRKHAESKARRRAEAALREAYGRVEQQVAERTADLAQANAALEAKIAEHEAAKEALRESESRLRQTVQLAGLGHCVWDPRSDRCHYCSEDYARIHGISVEDFMARDLNLDGALPHIHSQDRENYRAAMRSLKAGRPMDSEYRILNPQGDVRHVREMAEPVFDEAGSVVQEICTLQDITEHRLAEERLHQAQKMEAIGQLTGGVAHDFNNLLAVILGNAELLELNPQEESGELLQSVIRAAQRGSELTQRLLAFSRRKSLQPVVSDPKALVEGMRSLLRRAMSETIEVEIRTGASLWGTIVDPGQAENALLNLAVNAQHAMPQGGRLEVEAVNVRVDAALAARHAGARPGEYVMIAVRDDGIGMASEVLEHAFEPFFTTKEVGEGTGLGLSMVYGFVTQSSGFLAIESEQRRGTVVRLYLPRAGRQDLAAASVAGTPRLPSGRGERILVVEDAADVRSLLVKMLGNLGYRVLEAGDGESALALLRQGPPIALVVSDVVLPGGMSGVDLMQAMGESHPGVKVLLISGYAGKVLDRHGLSEGAVALNKPFNMRELALRVRGVLDR